MKLFVFALMLLVSGRLSGQEVVTLELKDPNWKFKSIFGINGSQTSFVNWAAGGRNNISALAFGDFSAYFKKGKLKWDNDLKLALGAVQFLGKVNGEQPTLQKTDDRIDFASNWGYKLKEENKWYFSAQAGFRTQMLDGFNFPNDSVRVSTFMAPGYGNFALGIDWKPNDDLSVFVSPVAAKLTWVLDTNLAKVGQFGVQARVMNSLGGVLTEYKQFRGEFGAYAKVKYKKTLATNIDFKGSVDLFSNYMNNPGNIDVNAEALFSFKVNSWFSASLQWNLIYDDDINIQVTNGAGFGPRAQFKSVLGLGISYTVKNYTEKK